MIHGQRVVEGPAETPRGLPLPVTGRALTSDPVVVKREGAELRGNFANFNRAAKRSSGGKSMSLAIAFKVARLTAYFATSASRFFSRSIMDFFAIRLYFLNGKLKASSNARPSSSFLAVVVIVMSIPRIVSMLS